MALQLKNLETGQLCPLLAGVRVRVGRALDGNAVDLGLDEPSVSRQHAELELQADGRLEVVDLGSSSGTFVNGKRVDPRARAGPGDTLQFGMRCRLVVLGGVGDATLAMGTLPPHPAEAGSLTEAAAAAAPPPVIAFDPGQRLAKRFALMRPIGRGGMGVVYHALDLERDTPCAVKMLPRSAGAGPAERFAREAQVAEQLGDHPAIVKVYAHGELPEFDLLYLVMDYVEGRSLGQLARGGLEVRRGVGLVASVAHAIHYAHTQQIIHRDLKPDNVLVSAKDDAVHLTDFGLAKVPGSQITGTGEVMGTPNYVAPEQLEDSSAVGEAVDVYGLGGILYTVLTRRPPYQGNSLGEILRKVVMGNLRPPRELVHDLDPALERICLQSLHEIPSRRPEGALAFAQALEAWLS